MTNDTPAMAKKRKYHEREIRKLEAAHWLATQAGDKEGAKMIAAEMARHALQQHVGM